MEETAILDDLRRENIVLVTDTSVLINRLDQSLNHIFQESYWTKELPPYCIDIINYAFQTKKIRLCAVIPQELHGVLYNKICHEDISLYKNMVDQLKIDHKDTIIDDVIKDIQDKVIPRSTKKQKYPIRDKTWPFEEIDQIYNTIKQKYSSEYKKYTKKMKKEPLDKGDKEILAYCLHLIKFENKKVIFYTNDKGITEFGLQICNEVNSFKIIDNFTYKTYVSFKN